MKDDDSIRQQRSTFLSGLFTLFFGGSAIVLSFLLCGGLTIYMLAVIGGLVAFGYVHYLLWGQALSTEVAEEREQTETEGELEDDGWTYEEPNWHHRL